MTKIKLSSSNFGDVPINAYFITKNWIWLKLSQERAMAMGYSDSNAFPVELGVTLITETK